MGTGAGVAAVVVESDDAQVGYIATSQQGAPLVNERSFQYQTGGATNVGFTELTPVNDAGAEVAGRGKIRIRHSDGAVTVTQSGSEIAFQSAGSLAAEALFKGTAPAIAENDTVSANGGTANTTQVVDNSGGAFTYTPSPAGAGASDGPHVRMTSTASTTINAMTGEGVCAILFPADATVVFAGGASYVVKNSQPSGEVAILYIERWDTTNTAIWL